MTEDVPADEPTLLFRLRRNPFVQVALFALTLAGLFVLDRLTRQGPRPLPSVLLPAGLIAVAVLAAGWAAVWLRRLLRDGR